MARLKCAAYDVGEHNRRQQLILVVVEHEQWITAIEPDVLTAIRNRCNAVI